MKIYYLITYSLFIHIFQANKFIKLTIEKKRGLTWIDPEETLVGEAVIGQAGSILCTRTSKENNFFAGNTSFHVCLNFHMLALVFSST